MSESGTRASSGHPGGFEEKRRGTGRMMRRGGIPCAARHFFIPCVFTERTPQTGRIFLNAMQSAEPVYWTKAAPAEIERVTGRPYDTFQCLTCGRTIPDEDMDWLDYWHNGPYHATCPKHPMVLGAGISRSGITAFMENGTVYVKLKKGAQMMGVGLAAMKRLVESGELSAVRVKRGRYVPLDEVMSRLDPSEASATG